MGLPEKLSFENLLKILPVENKRRNKNQKLIDCINDELDELGKRIYEYQGKGEITIKINFEPDKKRDELETFATVTAKYPNKKLDVTLYQGIEGFFYAEDPNQQKLDLVVEDINTKRRAN